MRKNIYFCKSCNDTGQNLKDLTAGNFSENQLSFYKGYIDEQEISHGDLTACPFCGDKIISAEISGEDYTILAKISGFNRQLLDAMVDLHKKDIVEYELKMTQFRSQYKQSQDVGKQKQESNTPKCPTCSSTNIQKIGGMERVGSVAMLGIFSKKINKSFKCKSCGYTW